MTAAATRQCCKIGCERPAEYEIWDCAPDADPYRGIDACTEHVGELLTDAFQHNIYRIPAPERA